MIERFPLEDLTPDDRRMRAKWACRLAVAYGAALLLLVAFVAASRMIAGPTAAPATAGVPAPHVAERAPAATPRRRN
jgi:hypothetical protein